VLWNPAISQLPRSFVSTIEKQALCSPASGPLGAFKT